MSAQQFDQEFRLGVQLHHSGDFKGAEVHFREAIRIDAAQPPVWFTLGNVLQDMRRLDDAVTAYQRAVALCPDYAEAHHNMGRTLRDLRRLEEALEQYRKAAALGMDTFELRCNLGVLCADMGQLDQSLVWFEKALELRPDPAVESNLVYTLHFHPDADPPSIARAHARWNQRYARPLKSTIRPHVNNPDAPDPERRLRIGYVSPDFRMHPVGFFINPLLGLHDRSRFEIYCYSGVPAPDAYTERLRSYANVWRETLGLTDEQLAAAIRADGIDILVDLTMHMAGSRLLTFARKPAPVQVTYLAYCSTTGLDTIDYRLSDSYLDPPGIDESAYSEKTVRLPSYWCYVAVADAPPVGPLPALDSGSVTFGCLNHYSKVTPHALDTWFEILRRTPGSRLILHCDAGSHQQHAWARMQSQGLDPARLEFVGFQPLVDYLNTYNRIDIALDPFPYTGGTTSCDALWMGVPLVTLTGKTAVSRGGYSILSNTGLPELVTTSRDQYVHLATDLAANVPRLATLRSNLRPQMRSSPLCNAPQYARDIEAAYRQMWRHWCGLHFLRDIVPSW
jgi:predicted O-linked N-acetylglucosamine transferase (SPINDLY family)